MPFNPWAVQLCGAGRCCAQGPRKGSGWPCFLLGWAQPQTPPGLAAGRPGWPLVDIFSLEIQHPAAPKPPLPPLPGHEGNQTARYRPAAQPGASPALPGSPPPAQGGGSHLLRLIKTSCNTCFVSFIRGKNIALVVKVITARAGSAGIWAFLGCRPQPCNWLRWLHLWLSDNWEPNKSPHKYLPLSDGKQLLWTLRNA